MTRAKTFIDKKIVTVNECIEFVCLLMEMIYLKMQKERIKVPEKCETFYDTLMFDKENAIIWFDYEINDGEMTTGIIKTFHGNKGIANFFDNKKKKKNEQNNIL